MNFAKCILYEVQNRDNPQNMAQWAEKYPAPPKAGEPGVFRHFDGVFSGRFFALRDHGQVVNQMLQAKPGSPQTVVQIIHCADRQPVTIHT